MSLALEVVLAAIANIIVGSLWYSPLALGRPWQRIVHPETNDDTLRQGMVQAMIAGSLAAVILAVVIATFSRMLAIVTPEATLVFALVLWAALMVPSCRASPTGSRTAGSSSSTAVSSSSPSSRCRSSCSWSDYGHHYKEPDIAPLAWTFANGPSSSSCATPSSKAGR